ncbi:MAG: type II toxin-antitoxin system VapC family toxin [Candidatus Dormibacteraeota bacterium]|uniref:Ribonuclease VapC n=1 Tax=Candidatus Amunia macphersoniae TaxID=3127014 RepID=A0A934KE80_9BACT|nr:type II toxin-antitoxin system VapC family toxin [Candidatus Dormibacteraeota bacterium]
MIVIDASVTLAWCFSDEASQSTDQLLDAVSADGAMVPALWIYEVTNVLASAERRDRITPADAGAFLDDLRHLPIVVEPAFGDWGPANLVALARQHGLTAYDCAYLDVAARHGLPLATQDRTLRSAAQSAGVTVVGPEPGRLSPRAE